MKSRMIGRLALATTAFIALALGSATMAQQMLHSPYAPKIGDPPDFANVRLVGYNDLQARSSYQPIVVHQGNRYLVYAGHHGGTADLPKPINPMNGQNEFNGTSIIDVTDPANPKYLHHIPGAPGGTESGGAQMVRVCPGDKLGKAQAGHYYMLRSWGGKGHETWDVTDPVNPVKLASIGGNYTDTHKSWWECDGGVAYVVSGLPTWRPSA